MTFIDIPLNSDLVEKGFVDWSDHRWYVRAHLRTEVQDWCETHIGPIEANNYFHIGYENEVMFETFEIVLNTDVIRIVFSTSADFIAFKMRWL